MEFPVTPSHLEERPPRATSAPAAPAGHRVEHKNSKYTDTRPVSRPALPRTPPSKKGKNKAAPPPSEYEGFPDARDPRRTSSETPRSAQTTNATQSSSRIASGKAWFTPLLSDVNTQRPRPYLPPANMSPVNEQEIPTTRNPSEAPRHDYPHSGSIPKARPSATRKDSLPTNRNLEEDPPSERSGIESLEGSFAYRRYPRNSADDPEDFSPSSLDDDSEMDIESDYESRVIKEESVFGDESDYESRVLKKKSAFGDESVSSHPLELTQSYTD